MKKYLMLFSHSPYGAHQHIFEANDDIEAKEKAIKRLEQSCVVSMTYELFEYTKIVTYENWTRSK